MPKAPNTAPGPLTEAVGEILRAERARRNFSDSSLAKAANVDRTAVGLILKGRKVPDIEVLESICLALGRTLTWVSLEAEAATNGLRFESQPR